MQHTTRTDDQLGSCHEVPDEESHNHLAHSPFSGSLPVEQRLRSRINRFLKGYGLSRMGKAIAQSWIQVGGSMKNLSRRQKVKTSDNTDCCDPESNNDLPSPRTTMSRVLEQILQGNLIGYAGGSSNG